MNDYKKRKLGGLWVKTDVKGNKYLSGNITFKGEKVSVVIFRNTSKKDADKWPDWEIFKALEQDILDDNQINQKKDEINI